MPGGSHGDRLRHLTSCTAAPVVTSPAAAATATAAEPELLGDEEVGAFVRDGFVLRELSSHTSDSGHPAVPHTPHHSPRPPRTRTVKLDSLSSDFHASVAAKCAAYRDELETKADSHRSYFSQIPELEEVLAAPELVGGLQSLLGAGYVQHPHRTMHTRQGPGPGGDQDWHKVRCLFASREACRDGHLVRSYLPRLATKSFTSVSAAAQDGHHIPIRHHFPRWIICFYYPTDVTEDMGPTAVIPSSHYYTTDRNDSTGPDGPGPWADDRLE